MKINAKKFFVSVIDYKYFIDIKCQANKNNTKGSYLQASVLKNVYVSYLIDFREKGRKMLCKNFIVIIKYILFKEKNTVVLINNVLVEFLSVQIFVYDFAEIAKEHLFKNMADTILEGVIFFNEYFRFHFEV